jgi:hypothetical protein
MYLWEEFCNLRDELLKSEIEGKFNSLSRAIAHAMGLSSE